MRLEQLNYTRNEQTSLSECYDTVLNWTPESSSLDQILTYFNNDMDACWGFSPRNCSINPNVTEAFTSSRGEFIRLVNTCKHCRLATAGRSSGDACKEAAGDLFCGTYIPPLFETPLPLYHPT